MLTFSPGPPTLNPKSDPRSTTSAGLVEPHLGGAQVPAAGGVMMAPLAHGSMCALVPEGHDWA